MTELVAALRALALGPNDPDARDEDRLMLEAADEIDRLNTEALLGNRYD